MKRKGLCLIMVLCMLVGCAQAGGGNGGAAAEVRLRRNRPEADCRKSSQPEKIYPGTVSWRIICPGKRRHPRHMENIPLW